MVPGDPKYRYLYAVWAFFECFLFGGLIYGWGSLVFILKDEGIYLDLCHNEDGNETSATDDLVMVMPLNGSRNASYATERSEGSSSLITCDERESKLALVFTIGSSVLCAGCYVIGQVNFKFGTRITRLAATAFFIPGALLIAFTSKEVPWLIFPGLICLALGGVTCFITNNQIALLFPTGGLAVVGFLCGGYDASATVLLLIKIAYENGITRQSSFICLAVLYVFTLVNTLWFLPKDFIKAPPKNYDVTVDMLDKKEITNELINEKSDNRIKDEVPCLKSSMLSPFYILHIFWISVLQLRFYFFLNSINTILENFYTTKEEVSQSTNVFMYVLMCGCFAAPFVGFVYVSQKRLFSNSKFPLSNALMPAVIPLAATTILCLVFSGLMMLEDPDMLYLVYVLVLFFRAFLYTMAAGFLSAYFPTKHFAILYGFQLLIGAIISVFQYALFSWAEASGFYQVNIFLLILMFTSFIHPLNVWKQCRTEKRTTDANQLKFKEALNARKN